MSLSDNLSKKLMDYLNKNRITTPEQAIITPDSRYLGDLNLSVETIFCIKSAASSLLIPNPIQNASQKYAKEIATGNVSTGCDTTDKYLRGGLRPGTVTEIFGESGSGKTQLALQITANTWQKGAVYISTENKFSSKRLQQMFLDINNRQNVKQDISKYGDKIYLLDIIELDDLKRCINVQLPRLLNLNKGICVVTIDSITAPFRHEFQNDMKGRAQYLKQIGIALMNIATRYEVAVLCINQVLSSMNDGDNDVIPCLGLTWSNLLTTRLKMEKIDEYCRTSEVTSNEAVTDHHTTSDMVQLRRISVVASPELPSTGSLQYIITQRGVSGINIQ